jgi:hypothetical protein
MVIGRPIRVHIENICLTLAQNNAPKRTQQKKYESAYKSMSFNMNLRRISRSWKTVIFVNLSTIRCLRDIGLAGPNWYATCECIAQ